jgi:outer membrane protein W
MKKIIIITLMFAAGICISRKASAQEYDSNVSLLYTFGVPFGTLNDHTGNWSGRGVTMEYQKEVSESFSVGMNIAYSVFCEQKPKHSYTDGTATITGYKYNYNNIIPILVTGNYTFGMGSVGPYVGLGVGTLCDIRTTDMGLFEVEDNNWHFAMSPQAGFIFDTGAPVSLKLALKYDHAFKIENSEAFSMLQMSIGLVFIK